jgi:hypothetical protein
MAKPSTTDIVGNILASVGPRYRHIKDVSEFQAVLPYRTVIVHDDVSKMGRPLPPEFTEHRLYLMHGSLQLASINLAFHSQKGLVNFSLFVIPREWFKRKAIKDCSRLSIFPYIRQAHPDAPLVPQMLDCYLFPDPASGLTLQVRTHLNNPACIGIGVAIMDSDFA